MSLQLIVMSGLPGSGKSTLAEDVARTLKLSLFSVDPIESTIIKSGIKKSFETGLAAYLVANTLASEQLKLGSSVIVDAVNAEEEGKNIWRNLAKRAQAQLVVIECVLDAALHKARIEARVRNLHGLPEVTWDDVEARRKQYTKWTEPTLKINTADDAASNTKLAIDYIRSR